MYKLSPYWQLCFSIVPMLSNTNLYHIVLINRAMNVTQPFFSKLDQHIWNLIFYLGTEIKSRKVHELSLSTMNMLLIALLIASISKRRRLVLRWKFTLLNNVFIVMQHFSDHKNKAPCNLTEKWNCCISECKTTLRLYMAIEFLNTANNCLQKV